MCLSHPETIGPHPWSMGKLSSMKPVPGAKKVGDCCCMRAGMREIYGELSHNTHDNSVAGK